MGFMDKVKDSVKDVDNKIGISIDKGKLDSQIRDEERKIEDLTEEIGKAVVETLKSGKTMAEVDIGDRFDKIKECEKNIEDLKAKKDAIGKE